MSKRETNNNKFTLSVLDTTKIWNESTARKTMQDGIELSKKADDLGYARFWFSENHNTEDYAGSTPELLASQALAKTVHIKLGAANIMLPHQSALKVVENFRTLEGVYPGRIDLGVSLTIGEDPVAARALHRTHDLEEEGEFEKQFKDMLLYLTDAYETNLGKISASPLVSGNPEVWLQEIENRGARYAAEYGTGLVVVLDSSPEVASEVIHSYRKFFRASPFSNEPKSILVVSVLCAETDDVAEEQAAILHKHETKVNFIGSPSNIGNKLRNLVKQTTANELMVSVSHPDNQVRVHTLELLSEEFQLASTQIKGGNSYV